MAIDLYSLSRSQTYMLLAVVQLSQGHNVISGWGDYLRNTAELALDSFYAFKFENTAVVLQ